MSDLAIKNFVLSLKHKGQGIMYSLAMAYQYDVMQQAWHTN